MTHEAHISPPAALVAEVHRQASQPVSPLLDALVDVVRDRFGGALDAVVMYGSCLHDNDVTDGLVDLYAIVDDYRAAYTKQRLRWFNRLIPPNVFYMEADAGKAKLRCKYAVLSRAHFEAGCSTWFHSYVWARFAQPVRLLYARDDRAASRVRAALASAVLRFLGEGSAALDAGTVTADELWEQTLRRSYAAELRPESGDRARYLVERNAPEYGLLTEAAAPALGLVLTPTGDGYTVSADERRRRRARRAWAVRRWQGRALSILRVSKALFTFENGVDYVAWKIERHTGEPVEVTPRLRRYPWIFGWGEIWRLLRRGSLR